MTYKPWNNVEIREEQEGNISTAFVCDLCGAMVPYYNWDVHKRWHVNLQPVEGREKVSPDEREVESE